jgi:hypothetical protein
VDVIYIDHLSPDQPRSLGFCFYGCETGLSRLSTVSLVQIGG